MQYKFINNWSIVTDPNTQFLTPDHRKKCLQGTVTGYSQPILSSHIAYHHEGVITTRNTKYILGKIDPEYERAYPNVKDRFFNAEQDM